MVCAHTHMHARTRTHTHKNKHTHTHTQSLLCPLVIIELKGPLSVKPFNLKTEQTYFSCCYHCLPFILTPFLCSDIWVSWFVWWEREREREREGSLSGMDWICICPLCLSITHWILNILYAPHFPVCVYLMTLRRVPMIRDLTWEK